MSKVAAGLLHVAATSFDTGSERQSSGCGCGYNPSHSGTPIDLHLTRRPFRFDYIRPVRSGRREDTRKQDKPNSGDENAPRPCPVTPLERLRRRDCLFPEIPGDINGRFCLSYEHVGRHGAADICGVTQQTLSHGGGKGDITDIDGGRDER